MRKGIFPKEWCRFQGKIRVLEECAEDGMVIEI
jgi:hypothetical protein